MALNPSPGATPGTVSNQLHEIASVQWQLRYLLAVDQTRKFSVRAVDLNCRRLNRNLFADGTHPESNIKDQAVRGIDPDISLFRRFEAGVRGANGKIAYWQVREVVSTVAVGGEVTGDTRSTVH